MFSLAELGVYWSNFYLKFAFASFAAYSAAVLRIDSDSKGWVAQKEGTSRNPAILVLEDGTLFEGTAIGADGYASGEVVFNTAYTGYQEILTDPSYCRQIVTLTYPHIGNVGVNDNDAQSRAIFASGLVIRDYPVLSSSWRSQGDLDSYLKERQVVGIADIDTRRLTRILRTKGSQRGCVVAGPQIDREQALAEARRFPGLAGMDLAKETTTEHGYTFEESVWRWPTTSPPPTPKYKVVAYDFGVKKDILRILVGKGCAVEVVPAQTSAEVVLARSPDGVFLSNGPGDPEPCAYAIEAIRSLLEKGIPIFGICLGHQLLALATGATTTKMKFGHHGANHPVLDLVSKQVMITSQNHGFCVSSKGLPDHVRVTHRSLFDDSIQGIEHTDRPAFGFQGHPEASPGPADAQSLFDRFVRLMQAARI
ncbi:MAG: glutamine-hydrolyzing carbamoyl-phosphate synthase small subunit [Myxococcales bacterium]|nr:glutamine-hydrolyzing carbamoyl-phosphate synthase small subunit [Myxococcales bacterium]